jgi:deferrochelatase/peroxidase EfeB
MTIQPTVTLELDDIQHPVLRPRPTPYAGAYILLRIDDRRAGREGLRRLIPLLSSAADMPDPNHHKGAAAVALSFQGLKALGVPADTLASFPEEFRQGMAARADDLGDTGESAPEHWEQPLGSPQVHVAIVAVAPDHAQLEPILADANNALRELPGVTPIWRQDTYLDHRERTSFGFKDGISNPDIEGSGNPVTNPHEAPFKAGEFVLGYLDGTGSLPLSLVGFSSSGLLSRMSFGLGVLLFGNRGPRWPRFRHEAPHHQSITSNQHPDDGDNATRKTTQHAWARTLRGGATSHMCLG